MKKLALIMLAVVSMALVSCGGGGLKTTEPAFTYAGEESSSLDGCFKVKNVAAREQSLFTVSVTVTLEVVKDIDIPSSDGYDYRFMGCGLHLYDKNMAEIGVGFNENWIDLRGKKVGDVINLNAAVDPNGSVKAREAIKEAKYVGISVGLSRFNELESVSEAQAEGGDL